jgi:hypothetical protein
VRGHTEPAFEALELSREAVVRARAAGAETTAAEALAVAESSWREAMAEHRRQEVRLRSLRDFRAARTLIERAASEAALAESLALHHHERAEHRASEALNEAERRVGICEEIAEALPLSPEDRADFQKARLAMTEAQLLHRDGDFEAAARKADGARELAARVLQQGIAAASRYRDPHLVRQWTGWVEETVAWSRRTGRSAIVVDKDGHTLTLYTSGKVLREYAADMGSNSLQDKNIAGDLATPEGRYQVTEKKDRGQSIYHRALLIDYPNEDDRREFERAKRRGEVPRNASAGNLIEIHGEGGRGDDWTRGCVALANDDMDDLFERVGVGTPVTIVGGNGRDGTLALLAARFEEEVGLP